MARAEIPVELARPRDVTSADDLFDALGTGGDLEIRLVRGADELTVTVAE